MRGTINFNLTLLLLFVSMPIYSAELDIKPDEDTGLGVGYAIVRFDTSVKFKNKQRNQSLFVDAEGTLGLPNWDTIPVFYGYYRFSSKHTIGFSYFQVRRESALLNFDETLDDIEIVGNARFSDDTRFYNLYYGYTLHSDERSRIQGQLGINVLDIKYVFEAQGTITYPDSTSSSSYRDETGLNAPMPLFGLDFLYSFTPKWAISTRVSFIAGDFSDYRGWIASTNINSIYQFNKNFGAVIGLSYFDADITIEDSLERTEVKYGYDGLFLGLHAVF